VDIITKGNTSTPLFIACEWGALGMAEFLIQSGADKSFVRPDGMSILHIAASNGHCSLIQQLVKKGAPIITTKLGTPFHYLGQKKASSPHLSM
jgi:ankyrin repeat protein